MSRSSWLPNVFEWEFFFEKLIFLILWNPKSLFSLDMFINNIDMSINKFQRSKLTFQPRSLILESHQHIKT